MFAENVRVRYSGKCRAFSSTSVSPGIDQPSVTFVTFHSKRHQIWKEGSPPSRGIVRSLHLASG